MPCYLPTHVQYLGAEIAITTAKKFNRIGDIDNTSESMYKLRLIERDRRKFHKLESPEFKEGGQGISRWRSDTRAPWFTVLTQQLPPPQSQASLSILPAAFHHLYSLYN